MSDIKNALAQLRAARSADDRPLMPPTLTEAAQEPTEPEPAAPPAEPRPAEARTAEAKTSEVRSEVKTLAGRVPLALHRELTRALLDAADELRVSRLNVDEALEAAMRVVLRDSQATTLWYDQLREVRRERRES